MCAAELRPNKVPLEINGKAPIDWNGRWVRLLVLNPLLTPAVQKQATESSSEFGL